MADADNATSTVAICKQVLAEMQQVRKEQGEMKKSFEMNNNEIKALREDIKKFNDKWPKKEEIEKKLKNIEKRWRSILVLGIAATVMLLGRLQGPTPQFATADNPTAKEPRFLTRFLTFAYLPLFNLWLLLYPETLSFDWGMDAIPRIHTVRDPRNCCSALFYITVSVLVRQCTSILRCRQRPYRFIQSAKQRASSTKDNNAAAPLSLSSSNGIIVFGGSTTEDKTWHCPCPVCHHSLSEMHSVSCRTNNNNNSTNLHSHSCVCLKIPLRASQRSPQRQRVKGDKAAVLLAVAFLALPFLPATNLLFYVGFVVAERVLYLPSAGWCLLCGIGAAKMWDLRKYRPMMTIAVFVVVLAFCTKTVLRNMDWFDEDSLYRSAIPINPPKATSHVQLYNIVRSSLVADASVWFSVVENSFNTFEEFEALILAKYWSETEHNKIRSNLFMGKFNSQKSNSREQYFINRYTTAQHLTPKLSENEIIRHFARHFDFEINKSVIIQNITTFKEFCEVLRQYDDLYKHKSTQHTHNHTEGYTPYYRQNSNQNYKTGNFNTHFNSRNSNYQQNSRPYQGYNRQNIHQSSNSHQNYSRQNYQQNSNFNRNDHTLHQNSNTHRHSNQQSGVKTHNNSQQQPEHRNPYEHSHNVNALNVIADVHNSQENSDHFL
ncbi:protein o-mannosyl-transferase tmtc2 [Holotrichia oblita]|uniref:Protein o-mannosyl-transferase tmtc2 n=1 Tax=Holotrichia oblita TaxID=644536 RepID=A0ACB9T831_HOLOL|nr:protein o-mannosyl-transferase tmtc2 [Holotrichia oblita]